MNKAAIIRAAAVLSTTAFIAAGSKIADVSAVGLLGDCGLAGISLSLQQYTESTDGVGTAVAQAAPDSENPENDATEASEELERQEAEEAEGLEREEAVSEYENVGISIADNYVNIRKKPDTESKILGKLYRGSAATILKTKGEWVKIKSGSVTGYINTGYLAIGFDVEELIDRYGTKWAEVTTTTLKVREKATTDSAVLTLIPLGESYQVIKEKEDWVKILLDEGDEDGESTTGWVSKDYVKINVEFEHAISIEEEEAERRREEEARKAEEEQLRKLEEQRRQQEAAANSSNNSGSSNSGSSNSGSSSSGSSSSSSGSSSSGNSGSSSSGSSSSGSSSSGSSNSGSSSSGSSDTGSTVASGDGSDIAAYAQKFVGNPYVYGGTSLTNGTDCSGFTQSVYKHFGISIPRTSSAQSGTGKKVSLDSLQAGDLVFYANNGRVNHVAMYIGGGQVVHASNPKSGIKISTLKYRTPYCARRIVD